MAEREILREMRSVLAEVRALGPCLDGNLLKNKSNKYVKKDGTVPSVRRARSSKLASAPS